VKKMGWSPPKKITYVLSILFFIIGLLFAIEFIWGVLYFGVYLPPLNFFAPTLTSGEVWWIISLFLMFLGWFLLILGIRVKGL
jgi:hypothetical protein